MRAPAPEKWPQNRREKTITNWQIDKWKNNKAVTHQTHHTIHTQHTHFDKHLGRMFCHVLRASAFATHVAAHPLPYRCAKVVNALAAHTLSFPLYTYVYIIHTLP